MNRSVKEYTLAMALAYVLCGCASDPVNVSDFKHKTSGGAVYDENFNSGCGAWTLKQGFELRQREGVTGSNALFASPSMTEKSIACKASRPIVVIPGIYDVSIKYRTENIKRRQPDRSDPMLILGYVQPYDKDGIQLKGQNFWVRNNSVEDWQSFRGSVTIPQGSVNADLIMVFDWWHTGKVWFDDITFEPSGIAGTIFPLEPSNSNLNKDGTIALRAYFHDGTSEPRDSAMLVSLNGTSKLLYPKDGVYRGDFGSFSGAVKVNAKLLALKDKTILAEHDYRLFRNPGEAPAGATSVDRFGRTLCDGKPMLPIGIFTYQTMCAQDLERLRDAGFDHIAIECMSRNLQGKNSNTKEEMAAMLDGLVKYKLKAMLQLTLMIPSKEHVRNKFAPSFDCLKDRELMLSATVKSVMRHPAFLCYYLSDENQRGELKEVQELRETINRIDPWHFTVTLTDRPDNFPFFVPTGDILCHDSYPLPQAEKVVAAEKALDDLSQMKTPIWFCSQAYLESTYNKALEQTYPSEGAMRALPLLSAIHGAKGFLFYSYHEIFAKGSKIDPQLPAKFWPEVVSAVKMLRELEPFILSTTASPELVVKTLDGKVRFCGMTAENGRIAVPLVALSPGKSSALVTVPEGRKYVSRYGLSAEQPDGKWLFAAKGIDCDILYSR